MPADATEISKSALRIEPLGGTLGAEILGFDEVPPAGDPLRQVILDAFYDHMVLVVRNQNLTPKQQADFTSIFGEIERPANIYQGHPEEPSVLVLTNAGRENVDYKTQTLYWHTESSFFARPALATILHPKALPSTGGDTLFVDMRTAYETLTEDMKKRLKGLQARHSYAYRMMEITTRRMSLDYAREVGKQLPDVFHPVVRVHQATGRKSLFLSELCVDQIVGLPNEESERILSELYRHALRPELIYRHKWHAGDVLVWDNTSLMHCAADIPITEPRIFHRSQTRGPVPSGE
jgi:alpha-ketoglutarate-dependent taurine dioxygenase